MSLLVVHQELDERMKYVRAALNISWYDEYIVCYGVDVGQPKWRRVGKPTYKNKPLYKYYTLQRNRYISQISSKVNILFTQIIVRSKDESDQHWYMVLNTYFPQKFCLISPTCHFE
jgi:hypothetical protein